MQKTRNISILLILILFQFTIAAQEFNYPIKKNNGSEFYIYTVEIQEGLYSISKKFGVKQTEIVELNPEVNDGLKAGQVIIIPKHTSSPVNTEKNVKIKFFKVDMLIYLSRVGIDMDQDFYSGSYYNL